MAARKIFGYYLTKNRAIQVSDFIDNLLCGVSEPISKETQIDISNLFRVVRMSARRINDSYFFFGTMLPAKFYIGLDDLFRDVSINGCLTLECDKDLYGFFEETLFALSDELKHFIEQFN